jgi:YVTN family beta-propeller protein
MAANCRLPSLCFSLLTFLTAIANPVQASVAYIANCCNHPSTVSVVRASTGQQTAQWTVGTGAYAAVFSPDGSIAYISSEVSQSVAVVEVASGTVLATIPVGYALRFMVISRDGATLYAESYDYAYESRLVAIDTATNTVTHVLSIANVLGPLAISPDGKKLYTNASFLQPTHLLVINTKGFKVAGKIPISTGTGVALTPDGKLAYVPNFGGLPFNPNVAVVDTSTNTVVATIPLSASLTPSYIAISPDGSMAWVSESHYTGGPPVITVIQTSTNQIVGQIPIPGRATPYVIVFSPNGKRAWVTANGNALDVINVSRMEVVSQIATLGSVGAPAISPDGTTLLLPNSGSSQVAAISEPGGSTLANIPVGDGGGGAAVSLDGTRAYITNSSSDNLSVIDTASKTVLANVPTPGYASSSVVVSPDGSKAYVANSFDNSVTLVDTTTFAKNRIPMPDPSYPSSITITPDGKHVYVAGNNLMPDFGKAKCYVFVIDTATNQVVSSIPVPYPMAVAASPDGTKVYVVGGTTSLYTISTATNTITSRVFLENGGPTQPVTSGIAVTPDGKKVFADDAFGATVFEVNAVTEKLVRTINVGNTAGILAVTLDGSELWVGDYVATSVSVIDVATGKVTKSVPLGSQSYGIAFGPY